MKRALTPDIDVIDSKEDSLLKWKKSKTNLPEDEEATSSDIKEISNRPLDADDDESETVDNIDADVVRDVIKLSRATSSDDDSDSTVFHTSLDTFTVDRDGQLVDHSNSDATESLNNNEENVTSDGRDDSSVNDDTNSENDLIFNEDSSDKSNESDYSCFCSVRLCNVCGEYHL